MGPLEQALKEVTGHARVRAAMPGSKGRYEGDFSHDVTELEGLDNLQNPRGVIGASEAEAARVYGVTSARYLVNGSSCGNLAMIFSWFHEGDRVLVERNCHKSVYNGLILRKLRPVFLYPAYSRDGIMLPASLEAIQAVLDGAGNEAVKGIILTTPTYSGLGIQHQAVYEYTRTRGLHLLLDGAHGAHLQGVHGFSGFYGACDAMVVSNHKTMGCLNQGSLLLNNQAEQTQRLLKYSNVFQTTSPSYLIMESIERSVAAMAAGIFLDTAAVDRIRQLPLKSLGVFKPTEGQPADPWKINLIKTGDGPWMYEFLLSEGVYPEMVTSGSVLLMLSPYNRLEELAYLEAVLVRLDEALLRRDEEAGDRAAEDSMAVARGARGAILSAPRPDKRYEMHEAADMAFEYVELSRCEGRVSSEMLIPYPPGVPLIVPGEIISREVINGIKWYIENGIPVQGIMDGKIPVLQGDETWES